MNSVELLNNYNNIKECEYKGEHYSVRDNGAVMRHPHPDKKSRKLDNQWTFGKLNIHTGYMEFANQTVHRIVAFAFLGTPENNRMVVDHIDTNRRNNRPDNLRWVTRLENVLLNPITRARIEAICGSVEAFLKDPAILKDKPLDSNYSWMRTVTKEEAKYSLERLQKWAKGRSKIHGGLIDDWVFTKKSDDENKKLGKDVWHWRRMMPTEKKEKKYVDDDDNPLVMDSLTPNAVQRLGWNTPTKFPQCPLPDSEGTLKTYFDNLKNGVVFSENKYNTHTVVDAALSYGRHPFILVMTTSGENQIKPWALAKVWQMENFFVHESKGTFFHKEGAEKYFNINLGRVWQGGEVFDDYC